MGLMKIISENYPDCSQARRPRLAVRYRDSEYSLKEMRYIVQSPFMQLYFEGERGTLLVTADSNAGCRAEGSAPMGFEEKPAAFSLEDDLTIELDDGARQMILDLAHIYRVPPQN